MRQLTARRSMVGAVVLAGLASVLLWPSSGASAASKAGDARVVAPVDNTAEPTPRDSGTTRTPFSLQLPSGAACRGDSANHGYRVQSYMVPATVDPATLQFGSVGPVPVAAGAKFREPLYDLNTNPYANAQTAMAAHPNGPGPIINIPGFNLSVFKAGDVPSGTYNIGIACTKGPASASQLDTFWNAQIIVSPGPSRLDDPLAWRTPTSAPSPSPPTQGTPKEGAAPVPANAGAAPGAPAPSGDARTVTQRTTGNGVGASRSAEPAQRAVPSGGPPSFGDPVRNFVPVPGASALGLVVVLIIGFVAVRVVVFVLRRSPGIPLGRSMTAPSFATLQEDR